MTEREYVETIRKAAEEYVAALDATESVAPMWNWDHVKRNLSPHTAIALCDAWLEKEVAE